MNSKTKGQSDRKLNPTITNFSKQHNSTLQYAVTRAEVLFTTLTCVYSNYIVPPNWENWPSKPI